MYIEFNHTEEEYDEKFGGLYRSGKLWDFALEDIKTDAITTQYIVYWYIGGRLYETNIHISQRYWEQVVQDYTECLSKPVDLTDVERTDIAEDLLNDDEMWHKIEESIDYYLERLQK